MKIFQKFIDFLRVGVKINDSRLIYLHEDINKPDARLWAASNLITTILLSLPIRKVHFTFIDFKTNGIYAKIFNRLNRDRNLYTVVHDSFQLSEVKKLYLERTQNVEEITESEKKIVKLYILLVIIKG